MPISNTITGFMTNSGLNPTFAEDTPVVLNKDYTQFDSVCSRFLTKNAIGSVMQCGLSIYAFDPVTNNFTTLVDSEEWCFVETATSSFEADFEESQCWVRAKDLTDLRTLSDEEFEKI